MGSIELRDVAFHLVNEEEREDFLKRQRKFRIKSFFKRMLISAVLIGIFVAFQLIARHTAPRGFRERDTIDKLIIGSLIVFFAFNFLSYVQLLYETKLLFDILSMPIVKVKVKKKEVAEVLGIRGTRRYRHLVCEIDSLHILDNIYVDGPIAFSNIKEKDEVYVACRENIHCEQEYYFVA